MKIKLDENIGMRGGELLAERAHDVSTVGDQKLSGAPDETIFAVCAAEGRVLNSAGIVILDLGPRASPQRLLDRLRDFLTVAEQQDVRGSLWIVEPGRVRIHLRRD